MSERRKASAKNKTIAYIAAILIHVVIIGAMLVNFNTKHQKVDAVDADKIADTVQATIIDESQIQKQKDKLKAAERERQRQKELERQRLEKLKREAEQEKKKIKDLQDKQKLEQEKAAELERKRKEIAFKQKKEEEQRKKDEAERKRKEKERKEAERKEQERQKRLAEEQRKKDRERIEQEQRELDAQRRLSESLAAEEAFLAEQRAKQRATTLMGKYSALIKEKVKRYRTISPDFERWLVAKVNVKLSPSGEVKSASVIKSSGNARYDRSVETAIYQASPLPIPSLVEDPEVNKLFQDLNLNFDMKGL